MTLRKSLTTLLMSLVLATLGTNIAVATEQRFVGAALPALEVTDKGELILAGDKVEYKPWSSATLTGKVHVLQYLAGRMSSSKLNEPFTDKLSELAMSLEFHQVTTIINLDDAMWGTSGFVASELKSNKKKYPDSTMVADKNGDGAKLWELTPEGSAIWVLSPEGKVLFFKDGGLSAEEIASTVELLQSQMKLLEQKTASTD